MFSDECKIAWDKSLDLCRTRPKPLESAQPWVASDYVSLFWNEEFGSEGELDRAIIARSAEAKSALYGARVFVIAPIYVTSICQEQCLYCNFRAPNKGVGVERRRLTDHELEQEALYLVEEKGLRVLELVYATDPRMRVDSMCRHVELLRSVLEHHGSGLVGISSEAFDEDEYRCLVDAGLCWSVLWQETYDRSRYAMLHPGKTKKARFEYRLDAYERMLAAGVEHVGIGVLSGLSDWKQDWTMLMLHEEYLRRRCGRGPTILGIPRLKRAPGAPFQESPFTPTRQEFLVTVALHNVFAPSTAAFVSTREDWDLCVGLARGAGCLFTLNCSTTPGGYSLHHGGCQFAAHSYDAPIYSTKLRSEGLTPVFDWKAADLDGRKSSGLVESPKSLIILTGTQVTPSEFVDFWEQAYYDPHEPLYTNNINAPRTSEVVEALFRWKLGRLFNSNRVRIQENFISRLNEVANLPLETTPEDFLSRFSNGGAISRIFWLHCWNQRFPMYDQNAHRAMTFIEDGTEKELHAYSDNEKIEFYLQRYLPFVRQFNGIDGRRVDRALFAFGKFLKEWHPPFPWKQQRNADRDCAMDRRRHGSSGQVSPRALRKVAFADYERGGGG